jgi:Poly(R)-hydroxyalkanoic acid synthase subunit (PHA_synth_III_E)
MNNTANDPMAFFRQMVSQWEKAANEFGGKVASSSEFAQGMHGMTTASLTVQQAVNEATAKALTAANMPTRADMVALGERLGAVEARLIRIEALLTQAATGAAQPSFGPRRTRKPPPK